MRPASESVWRGGGGRRDVKVKVQRASGRRGIAIESRKRRERFDRGGENRFKSGRAGRTGRFKQQREVEQEEDAERMIE
jgi:hypothetical protein